MSAKPITIRLTDQELEQIEQIKNSLSISPVIKLTTTSILRIALHDLYKKQVEEGQANELT